MLTVRGTWVTFWKDSFEVEQDSDVFRGPGGPGTTLRCDTVPSYASSFFNGGLLHLRILTCWFFVMLESV